MKQDNMTFSHEDITRLARLAGLQLNESETAVAQSDLDRMVGVIRQLQAIDTSGVEPMAHPTAIRQESGLRLRDDTPDPAHTLAQRDAIMINAPAAHEGLFLVPTVLE